MCSLSLIQRGLILFFLAFLLGEFPPALKAAKISGVVELEPAPPQRRMVNRYSDTDMEQLGPPAPVIAVVYLTGDLPEKKSKSDSQPPRMEQIGLQFHPRVLPVQVGDTVAFPNLDNTFHNVFSYSPGKRFDLGRYRKGEGPPTVTFDQPGEVAIFCEVHEHMRATVLVLETAWYTSTDKEGHFTLQGVPPGDYTLHVWVSPRSKTAQEITVGQDGLTGLRLKP